VPPSGTRIDVTCYVRHTRRMKSSIAVAAAGALLVLAGAAGSATPGLVATLKDERSRGEVGVGISLVFKLTFNGKRVKTLPAGTYKLVVNDQSRYLQFHLMGPRVDISTGVATKGRRTFTVRLRRGRYFYQSDPHASTTRRSFTVRPS
jgi:hypothetical protein